jgi:hypothetical protein
MMRRRIASAIKSPESQRKAQEGRDLCNEGRVEDGEGPKTTKPGTGHPAK